MLKGTLAVVAMLLSLQLWGLEHVRKQTSGENVQDAVYPSTDTAADSPNSYTLRIFKDGFEDPGDLEITSLTAAPDSIAVDGYTVIRWTTESASSCEPSDGTDEWRAWDVELPDGETEITISSAGDYTFTLTCYGEGDNSVFESVTVAVHPTSVPDLVVVNPGVSHPLMNPDQAYSISVSVENQGDVPANSSQLRYYLSDDTIIGLPDAEIGGAVTPQLQPGESSPQTLDSSAPGENGVYWLGACVDPVAGEFDIANQCSTAVRIEVVSPLRPDLAVINPGVSNATLEPGQAFSIMASAINLGNENSPTSTLRYYLSQNNSISPADTLLGSDVVPVLPQSASSPQEIDTVAPLSDGVYWVGACVDPVTGETNTSNQCSAAVQIIVGNSSDRDGDRLPDSVETNTGVLVDLADTGTDPDNPDTDGDGIRDGDELMGTLAGLDLPGLGTNPLRQDALIEYDWFDAVVTCSGSHSHRPSSASMTSLVSAFANAPVVNPDGSSGINVINDYGQGGLFTGGNMISDADGIIESGIFGDDYRDYKDANLAVNRRGYFRYVLLPHRYDTSSSSSGQAEIGGDDMIVSLQCNTSDSNVANTTMHELGHNLSLHHGGRERCNYKRNYNSVMNYAYQFSGVDDDCTPAGNGVLDYSRGSRPSLDENELDENNGICGPGNPWDWDGDEVIESSVTKDINVYDDEQAHCGGTLTILEDYDDWDNLYFGGLSGAPGARLAQPEIITEQPVPAEYRSNPD